MYDLPVSRATGSSALSFSLDAGMAIKLHQVTLHLSAAGASGTLTITKDAGAGAAYDTLLYSQDMTSVTDLVYAPEVPIYLASGDKLLIAWANAGGKTYGLEVAYE